VEQIVVNLVVNARDAMPRGGKLVITTGNCTLESPLTERELTIPPGRYATLSVVDNGCGMDEVVQSRIFEPFFTTKEQGKGTGLGMATVYGIVKQSQGYIRVQSTRGIGTSVTVYLPEAGREEPEAETPSKGPVTLELTGKETVLLVEDEEMVRELAVESLRGYGYTILQAPDGERALSIAEGYEGEIDLLITDLVMPGMNGIELARRFQISRPGVPVLFMSGYSDEAVEQLGEVTDRRCFLQKPITPSSLSRKVREIFSVAIPA
jgi:CheY-like chemotaxis protein